MFSLWLIFCLSFVGLNSIAANNINAYIRPGVVRPCAYDDLDCIRKFFAENSACSPVYGPIPDPLVVTYSALPIPHANLTLINDDAQISGLKNVVVKEFYINKGTGRFVLEVEYDEIVLSCPKATIRYHLRGREPVERSDTFYIAIRKVSITMVVPYENGIQLSKGQVFTYFADSNVSYSLGRNFVSSDPGLQKSLFLLLAKLPTTLQEGYLIAGPLYLSVFIESNLCKFTK